MHTTTLSSEWRFSYRELRVGDIHPFRSTLGRDKLLVLPWCHCDVITILKNERHHLQRRTAHGFKIWPFKERMAFCNRDIWCNCSITAISPDRNRNEILNPWSAFVTWLGDSHALRKAIPKIGDWGRVTVALKSSKDTYRTNEERY